MARSMTVLLGYYAVALVVVAVWTYRDHAVTALRVRSGRAGAERAAGGFLDRIAVLLGLLASGGAALLLSLLPTPAPVAWIVATAAIADGVVTAGCVELVLRSWLKWFGTDPLADLRPGDALTGTDQPPADTPGS
jgi:hypothetical protein